MGELPKFRVRPYTVERVEKHVDGILGALSSCDAYAATPEQQPAARDILRAMKLAEDARRYTLKAYSGMHRKGL